jgi:2-polyprenyl-6-methoxyphenol hydroxylase-like FAD-dependent oxidoreductase
MLTYLSITNFQPDGEIIGYFGNAFIPNRGDGQRGNLRIPRQVLRRLLLEKLSSSTVVFGKQFVRLTLRDFNKLSLAFGDGSTVEGVDLLISADGIRSSVVKEILPNDPGPKYIGIMIVLGIAKFCHPLLDERGFYTLDGNHRLFTMPYEGAKPNGNDRRIMWQLSYTLNESEAKSWSLVGPQALKDEVLRRCNNWHDPVIQMIQSTPLETIWGTGLMDRDPEELVSAIGDSRFSNVVVLGDAAHSMSPFKGMFATPTLGTVFQALSICHLC